MIRKTCLLLLLLVGSRILLAEVEFDIDTKMFSPRVYYIGDEVELQLKIKLLSDDIILTDPAELPAEQWIEIRNLHSIVFPADTLTLNVLFVTYKPGKHILPPLDLGGIVLEGIEVETQSILAEYDEKKIRPRRGQLELPGTRLIIILAVLGVSLLPVMLFFIIRYSLRTVVRIQKSRQREVPRNRIRRALRRLARQVRKLDSRQFYIYLADILRDYLQRRFSIPALNLTPRELTGFFRAGIREQKLRESILRGTAILQAADVIKFGGQTSSAGEKQSRIEEILKIVESIEQESDDVES